MPAVIAAIVMIDRPLFIIDDIVHDRKLQMSLKIREQILHLNHFSVHTALSARFCTCMDGVQRSGVFQGPLILLQ